MKPFALALLLLATTLAADDLIDAAKAAKAKRRKSTSKVITNADLKKSKGKVVETKELPPLPADLAVPQQGMVEKHEAQKKARADAELRLTAAQQKVAALEKELAAIEQKYYEENDLDRRDGELVRQFDDVKTRLDAARQELRRYSPPQETPAEQLH